VVVLSGVAWVLPDALNVPIPETDTLVADGAFQESVTDWPDWILA
jgi:hypothetical protein